MVKVVPTPAVSAGSALRESAPEEAPSSSKEVQETLAQIQTRIAGVPKKQQESAYRDATRDLVKKDPNEALRLAESIGNRQ